MKGVNGQIERWLLETPKEGPWTILRDSDRKSGSRAIRVTKHYCDVSENPRSPSLGTGKYGLRVLAEKISAALNSNSNDD